MSDARSRRISRELFVAAVGGNLATLEPWVMDRLTAILEEEELRAGDPIFMAGETPEHFYFVRQGPIALVSGDRPPEVLEGPRAFGMLDGLVERPRSESAYARAPLQLLRVRMDAWLELLEDSFELARMSVLRSARAVAAHEERCWARGIDASEPAALTLDTSGGPLDVVERLAILMQTRLLCGAGAQPISDLAILCDEASFTAGERLFERGVPMDRIFVPIDGRVEATREQPHVGWRGGPGQVVCGVLSFAEQGSAWEAHAVTQTRTLSFGIDDWFDVMEENFEMVRSTLATLAMEAERLRGVT